ncbi:hypothetical protein LXL04_019651 [Taraxacum kok-saghyz]
MACPIPIIPSAMILDMMKNEMYEVEMHRSKAGVDLKGTSPFRPRTNQTFPPVFEPCEGKRGQLIGDDIRFLKIIVPCCPHTPHEAVKDRGKNVSFHRTITPRQFRIHSNVFDPETAKKHTVSSSIEHALHVVRISSSQLEAMRAKFFWGGSEAKRKMHWIKWDSVLAAKDKGGLEVGSLVIFNLALVLKWRWRFVNEDRALWVKSFACSNKLDVWRWTLDEEGEFSVGETRRWIDNKVLPSNLVPTRWCKVAPRKVNVFIWRLRLDRLPTRVRLRERDH